MSVRCLRMEVTVWFRLKFFMAKRVSKLKKASGDFMVRMWDISISGTHFRFNGYNTTLDDKQ